MDLSLLVQINSVEEVPMVVLMTLCHWFMRDHEGEGGSDGGVWREYWI